MRAIEIVQAFRGKSQRFGEMGIFLLPYQRSASYPPRPSEQHFRNPLMTRRICHRSAAIAFYGFLILSTAMPTSARAGVLLQGFYTIEDPNNPTAVPAAVPSSVDGTGDDTWWDHLAKQAADLRQAGFTAIWIPPVYKGASGKSSTGYDPFDDYDLGAKNQRGTIPTHYGTREQLQRCVAIYRANGIDVYVDLVENHRNGDPRGRAAQIAVQVRGCLREYDRWPLREKSR